MTQPRPRTRPKPVIRMVVNDSTYLAQHATDFPRLFCGADDEDLVSLPIKFLSELYAVWYHRELNQEGRSIAGTSYSVMMRRVQGLVSSGRLGYFTHHWKGKVWLCAGQVMMRGASYSELFKTCLDASRQRSNLEIARLPEDLRREAKNHLGKLLHSPELVIARRGSDREIILPEDRRWYAVDGNQALLYGGQEVAQVLRDVGRRITPCDKGGIPLCGLVWLIDLRTFLVDFPELWNPFRDPLDPSVGIDPCAVFGRDVLIQLRELGS